MGGKTYIDQTGRAVEICEAPARIVSIVPSQTELLYSLGLEDRVMGITKFCVLPETWFRNKKRIGGTKNLHVETIKSLKPDLIIGNKEENERSQIEELEKEFPIWLSDVKSLAEAIEMIKSVGEITDMTSSAEKLAKKIQLAFSALAENADILTPVKAAYFIWQKPYMVAASETFIHAILQQAGFINVFSGIKRYPKVTEDDLKAAYPEVILLSSEPYPFGTKHIQDFRELCPHSEIKIADGQMFSWYGSRLQYAPAYLAKLKAEIVKSFKKADQPSKA